MPKDSAKTQADSMADGEKGYFCAVEPSLTHSLTMHKLHHTAALLVLLTAAACGSGTRQQEQPVGTPDFVTTVADNGNAVLRQDDYAYSDTVRAYGSVCHYSITRTASAAAPTVEDDEGTVYADNVYTIDITTEGRTLLHRQVTKADVAALLGNEVRRRGIIDGMMCDKSEPGLTFAISVSLPQTDMFEPLLMRVGRDGSVTFERDQRSEWAPAHD